MYNKLTVQLVTISLGLICSLAPAQILSNKVSTEFIPDDAFAAAALFPKQISENPSLELLPREIITAWGRQMFGFDPIKIRQLTFIVDTPESLEAPPRWGAVLSFDKIQGLSDRFLSNMDEEKLQGRKLYRARDDGMPSILMFDESTILMGDADYFKKMLSANRSGVLVELIERSRLGGQAFAFANIVQVRKLLVSQISEAGPIPPPMEMFTKIPELLDSVELSNDFQGKIISKLLLHSPDEDAAEELNQILVDGMFLGKQMLLAQMAANMDADDPIQEATIMYMKRLAESFEKKLTPEIKGKSLVFNLENEVAAMPILLGMLLPAAQQTRSAARRAASMNNGRQLMLSLHNYLDVNKAFPAQANYDDQGRPLLSWRVHVLPFLEQQALYNEFHLDEPWDSPHNKKLIARMPAVFRSPDTDLEIGKTIYLGVSGEGMAFSREPLKIQDIRDGSSNTVMIVEVDPGQAVDWTKPEDYQVDARNPLRGLGGIRPAGFSAMMGDGSVTIISPTIDPEVWRALLTIDGGEVIGDF